MNSRSNANTFGAEQLQCQFARVVKGVDLRSTAGNCAWVRTPQLTYFSDRPCSLMVQTLKSFMFGIRFGNIL